MKSLAIMGMPRGGTTVTMDLFRDVPGVITLDEAPFPDMRRAVNRGHVVVWKSPHDCLKGSSLAQKLPHVQQIYVIKDGRANLASHKTYLEKYGTDPSWAPYQGPKGFASLWNKFATRALKAETWFRLEDLISEAGHGIIGNLFALCEYTGADATIDFWRGHIRRRSANYPRKAVSLDTPFWRDILTEREAAWIDRGLLEALGYE